MAVFYTCGIHEVDINDEYKAVHGCDCEKAKEVNEKFEELIFTVPVKKMDYRCAKTLEEKKEILHQLLSLWERVPDWRLGQLIWNCYQGHDFFFITDYRFIKDIEDMLDKK
jgi:hypothetical protein